MPSSLPYISKLYVCDQNSFENGQNACGECASHFAVGIQKIFLSFMFHNMPTGKKYKRSWYRNGEQFVEKTDFYDDAWPGYTYLWNESGHDLGDYTVRITVDEKIATVRFTVGSL
jgi:hypothetical protein